MPTASSVTAAPSSRKYPRPGLPSVRAIVRVTKSYVTRGSAIGDDPREIRHRGLGVEARQHVVAARVPRELEDLRVVVAQVAEHDRFRRTRLGARGDDLAVAHGAVLEPGAVLRAADPLHAEGAFLHHALLADGDVRIEQHLQRLGPRVPGAGRLSVVVPVEVADLVRAVVGAIARADAAVIDLPVEAVGGVIGGVHGTDRLARRVAALLAHHRRSE